MADKNQKFEVRNSSISGKGLFATTLIKADEVVVSWHPKVLTREQADALPASEHHYLYPDGDKMLYMQAPERYMNHSCEPNTRVVGKRDVACCNINPGEEITSDYVDLETENFMCQCGSANCRSKDNK
ncbi:SET domain-containing protein [Candidatus Saccharibacteria bacterium]|nr:SET domain-containing protein [Candidatus Saccharibacteria bacterium]